MLLQVNLTFNAHSIHTWLAPMQHDSSASRSASQFLRSSRSLGADRAFATDRKSGDWQRSAFSSRASAKSEPGDTFKNPQRIPFFLGKRRFSDSVSRRDPDFYRLNLLDESDLQLKFRNQSASKMTIAVLNSKGTALDGTTTIKANQKSTEVFQELPPGAYFLSVTGSNGKGEYTFNLTVARSCGCGPES